MKNCEYYEELIGAAIDGEITAEEDKELRAHLESCGTCRSFYEAMQAIAGTDNALGEPPEDFTANVMALVHKAAAPQEKAPAKNQTKITRQVPRGRGAHACGRRIFRRASSAPRGRDARAGTKRRLCAHARRAGRHGERIPALDRGGARYLAGSGRRCGASFPCDAGGAERDVE